MVQAVQLSDEEKKKLNRETCLDEELLRGALVGKLSNMGHKLRGTKPKDFLPTGKVCKLRGALLLETEREQYEKNYCKIDPAHKICKTEEGSIVKEEKVDIQEVKEEKVDIQENKKSGDANAGIVLLSSSSCSCLVLVLGMMMMMRR